MTNYTESQSQAPFKGSEKAVDNRALLKMLTRLQRGQYELQQRLVRMETRLVRLMEQRGLNPEGDAKDNRL